MLITPSVRKRGLLNIKHEITYPRLAQAIQKTSILQLLSYYSYSQISDLTHSDTEDMPIGLYLESAVIDNELEDAKHELDGSLWFTSLLSRIDGLILIDAKLAIQGFGVEILLSKRPNRLWQAYDADATIDAHEELAYERYGTRHRSMMRYVAKVPGSVGFVISQDGPVRGMTMVGPDLVMWDNIQLELDFSSERPATRPENDRPKT